MKFHDNLLRVQETQPEIFTDSKNGLIAVARTSKSFSRQPIDLTLEQTINAGNPKTGITYLTNNIDAMQRWAENHFVPMTILTQMLENIKLTKKKTKRIV